MKVEYHENIEMFIDLVFEFLIEHEAENNILFAILNALKKDPHRYGDIIPDLITVTKDGELKQVSIRTPPYNQLLSYTNDLTTIDALINKLIEKDMEIPGVLGFKEGVTKFASIWCEKKNFNQNLMMNERVYKLESVAEETLGDKELIIADESHEEIVLKWTKEFILEAFAESSTEREMIESHMKQRQKSIKENRIFLLFDDGRPISMAQKAGKTPNGNLVNLVYTPPSLRRKGYATECVAKLSKYLLDEGNKYCFLFTDLANPTSNSIYQKIGYRPIIDFDQIEFVKKDS